MIKEELLLFVEIEDRAVTVFVDRDWGLESTRRGKQGTQVSSETRVFYLQKCVYVSLYKAALGSKKIEQKQSQANNNLERARKHSIS